MVVSVLRSIIPVHMVASAGNLPPLLLTFGYDAYRRRTFSMFRFEVMSDLFV